MNFNGKILFCTHKFWEIELLKLDKPENLFNFKVKWSIRGDHCGLELSIEIYKCYTNFLIYDHRHWNWKEDRFLKTGEVEVDFDDVC